MFTHEIWHIDSKLEQTKVATFKARNSFSLSAFARFRSYVKLKDKNAKLVKDTTVAGAHYTMPDATVYELR